MSVKGGDLPHESELKAHDENEALYSALTSALVKTKLIAAPS